MQAPSLVHGIASVVGVDCRSVYGGACYEGLLGAELYELEEGGDVSGGAGVLFADCARGYVVALLVRST